MINLKGETYAKKNLYPKNYIKKNKKLFFLRKKLCTASHTYNYVKKFFKHCDKEILIAITLDSKNYISSISIVSIGSINTLNTTPSEVFKTAIITNSNSIILVHNHPSGDPTPSKHDIEETLLFNKSSKILGINFLDHIIIGDNNFFSFKKHNII
ncbi:JAB domain-containing protein [Clostridium sp.]|uniref:JAB domain-containing protein n=1 Tax=Clostridium sp. TaxID=1506 RepID=UPI003441B403